MKRCLSAAVLLIATSLAVWTPAAAAPTYPEFVTVAQSPSALTFDSPSEHLTLTQEMDDPAAWTVVSAKAFICTTGCDNPANFTTNTDWLRFTGQRQVAQQRFLTFEGDIPEYVGYSFQYYFEIVYDMDAGPGTSLYPTYGYHTYNYDGATYYNFREVTTWAASRVALTSVPASITPGSAITFSGTFNCYKDSAFRPGAHADVHPLYRLPGSSEWNWINSAQSYDSRTGVWSTTVPSFGTTADWKVDIEGHEGIKECRDSETEVVRIEAGSGPPPPPPVLPGAPGLTLSSVTTSTATVDWSPATGSGITGYRFGWTSDSGLPVPSWSKVYTSPSDPFVMTNLNPDSDYSVYVEAVAGAGAGARATIRVHTAATTQPPPTTPPTVPTPPPPTTPPTVPTPPPPTTPPTLPPPTTPTVPTQPPTTPATPTTPAVAPSAPTGLKAKAGIKKITIKWKAVTGATKYQVHRNGVKDKVLTATSFTWKKLKSATYTLYVRAGNDAGWSGWAKVKARPKK